ncbi:uncharacterized protein SPSC_01707 [Sporisorium scitamineum]|uniref:Uncharacterized protein n=1 Tax=Sporisorium scitamineum TaxID=49012 RepID=A0A127ZBS7_9BASI|nr:uncharacterized protein SPSC_01707 [Sporisorium scitamineum]
MRRSHVVQWILTFCLAAAGLIRCSGLPPNDIRPLFRGFSYYKEALSRIENALSSDVPIEGSFVSNEGASSSSSVANTGVGQPRMADPATTVPPNALLHAPFMIEPLSTQKRREILLELYVDVRKHHHSIKTRPVLPLILENMTPDEYSKLFRGLISSTTAWKAPKRYYWDVDNVRYLLGRPNKPSWEFFNLHGVEGEKQQNMYAVWRFESHRGATVWRYLGVLDMPSRPATLRFIANRWKQLENKFMWPTRFLNDAAHFDPEQ